VIYLLYVVHVIVCVFLILVVLLQQGKGADLSVFGGGSTQTAFGARSATTMLHKLTVASFVVFILTTVSIALFKGGPSGGTVMAGHGKKAAATKPALPAKGAPITTAPVTTAPIKMAPITTAPVKTVPAAPAPAPAKPPQ
jgi:preprotein translocase subunit SecG